MAAVSCLETTKLDALTGLVPPKRQLPEWALGPFLRAAGVNPLIVPNSASVFISPLTGKVVLWEALETFNPAAAVKDGEVHILYRAEEGAAESGIGERTSRLGLATSIDGTHFNRHSEPVLYPARDGQMHYEGLGGCEDPRLVETEQGDYLLTYTRWDRKVARIGIARSSDMVHWEKYDHAFSQVKGHKYEKTWAKSGAIVTRREEERLIATKIHGKYWMYWGDESIYAAISDDLLHWQPVEDKQGRLVEVLAPRRGKFDSAIVEPGPPAILTEKGILLLYNGKNSLNGDPSLGVDAYAAGQALFSAEEPTKSMARLDQPFIKPETPYEKKGQFSGGTTFIEGLVPFNKKWLLYYGCADSYVAVAEAELDGKT